MKKNKTRLTVLFACFIVFLGILYLQQQWPKIFSTSYPQAFSNVNKSEIIQISIFDAKQETDLYKKNNEWYLKKNNQEYRADQERVNRLIDNILAFKKQDLVSTNKARHQEFGIDKQKIGLKTKDQQYFIFIGNAATLSGSNYVRIGNENEVYTAVGFDDVFTSPDYRDLNIHLITDENNVSNINVAYDDTSLTLSKKNNKWILNNKEIAHERVDFFINDLQTLKADDILDQKAINGLSKSFTITFKENNKDTAADFYLKDKDNYYLKQTNSPYIYEVKSGYAESLKKTEKDFTE